MLRLALQKSGRLSEESIKLMRDCDLEFEQNRGSAQLKVSVRNFPMEFLFLRDDDIPGYVADGVCDLGIVGQNVLIESGADLETIETLGFSRCRVSLAVPRGSNIKSVSDLSGRRIATTYPTILNNFLNSKSLKAEIQEISGSVEVAPSIGLADAIFDIVGTGSTLLMNGLEELEVGFQSQAVLVAAKNNLDASKKKLIEKLRFRLQAVLRAKGKKYLLLNSPQYALGKILSILPGLKSPTVIPLAEKDWCSVHTVVHEDEFWEMIENLKEAGAEGILVWPVEKIIP